MSRTFPFFQAIEDSWLKKVMKIYLKLTFVNEVVTYDNALRIYNAYIKEEIFVDALDNYIRVCITIDDHGGLKNIREDYYLISMIVKIWVQENHFTDQDLSLLDDAVEQGKTAHGSGWYYPKLHKLRTAILQKGGTIRFASSLWIPPDVAKNSLEKLAKGVGSDVKLIASGLAQEIVERREYGVKTSYFQDGVFHSFGQAWIVSDLVPFREELRRQTIGSVLTKDSICVFALADASDARKIHPKVMEEGFLYGIELGILANFTWSLDREGELVIIVGGEVAMPVRQIFAERGKENEYETLRLYLLLRLYNLVVPIEVVRQIPSLPTLSGIRSLLQKPKLQTFEKILDPDMILPRIRWIEERSNELDFLLEQEIDEAEAETRSRIMREHQVEWMFRRLPPGYKASPEARMRAQADLQMDIPEGRTYVRSHKRGKSGPEITVHRAVIKV